MTKYPLPILYTFRRCPYAIRARLALFSSGVESEIREVVLRDKPQEMLDISAKGTVPVLQLPNGQVIDESIDIVNWALQQNDPLGLLYSAPEKAMRSLIEKNDHQFKSNLDFYKYAVRFPEKPSEQYRLDCEGFLDILENKLRENKFLFGDKMSLADLAIFPFVRQFAAVDRDWFAGCDYKFVRAWLNRWLAEPIFLSVMIKYLAWLPNQKPIFLAKTNSTN